MKTYLPVSVLTGFPAGLAAQLPVDASDRAPEAVLNIDRAWAARERAREERVAAWLAQRRKQ